MEPKSEGRHENDEDDYELDEGVDDIVEDDYVLAEDDHLPHVDQEVDPGHGDGPRTHPPHPAGPQVGMQGSPIRFCNIVIS